MASMFEGLSFAVLALCAATMGFAIQRGATCTVAAVDELLTQRGMKRLLALIEAALCVAGGLLIAHRLGWVDRLPVGHALSGWTLIGAALLGLGAFVNGACVFGAIARLGSGQWAYAATPLGFYLGCVSVHAVFTPWSAPPGLEANPALLLAPAITAWIVGAWLVWRLWRASSAIVRRRRDTLRNAVVHAWSPHVATLVIGLAFLAMFVIGGAWAYTDVLADLARGMARSVGARAALLTCLLAGAIAGGWSAGRLRPVRLRALTLSQCFSGGAALLRCLGGGALMGWGSLLIPGGNDGLILVGMPLLWPYAWAAFATMCLAIGGAQTATRRLQAGAVRRSLI